MRPLLTALAFWLISLSAEADQRLFYQPQNADAALGEAQWQRLWRDSVSNGVDTLIVQWTRYGQEDFGGADGWLAQALRSAEAQGLELVLGLAYDPDYYSTLPDPRRFATYWHAQLTRSLDQRQRLLASWGLDPVGWYLPLELDDQLFREPTTRQELRRQLRDVVTRVGRPLHVSAFSAGFLAPHVMADWLGSLDDAGLRVWWQDGQGTQGLPDAVRQAYESALDCRIGIVREAFRQTSGDGETFAATAAEPDAAPACHDDTAVFSLRYRPWAKALVEVAEIP